MKMSYRILLLAASLLLLAGCGFSPDQIDADKITSINIIDRNGLSETINSKDRLNAFDKTDFLATQPYQKVMRVYGRQENGDVKSCITSYHPNGQIKQYLEAINNRAFGIYREWYPNGTQKVEATIIGGLADINTQAEQSWLFEGTNKAWDEEGTLVAEIRYMKGALEGSSIYYHSNGKIWKDSPYNKNRLHGEVKIYLEDGVLLQTATYQDGERNGPSYRHWSPSQIAYQEDYEEGALLEAVYYDRSGALLSSIHDGRGQRAVFGKRELFELQEYQNGVPEGRVKVFDEKQNLVAVYAVKTGEREGEEINYYSSSQQPKLLLTWHHGILQGPMKTWYENGQLESQREMSGNCKQGLLMAWYLNGSLMLVEEYDNDKLVKGEYYRQGERNALSQVERGKGVATLFHPEGHFLRKIHYEEGRPIE